MSNQQYTQFLTAVLLICALGAMLNIAKIRTRGRSAKLLAGAFLTMGLAVFLLRSGANQILISLAGGATFGLLGADFALRIGQQAKRPRR